MLIIVGEPLDCGVCLFGLGVLTKAAICWHFSQVNKSFSAIPRHIEHLSGSAGLGVRIKIAF
jgi:hypothetical protein